MAFTDLAFAAAEAKAAADAAADAAAHAAAVAELTAAARLTMTPVLTDHTGKVRFDPKNLTVPYVDVPRAAVVVKADTQAFLVRGKSVRLARGGGDNWQVWGPELRSLPDVGNALKAGT